MFFEEIAKLIAERTGCDITAIKPESKITELGIDSLDTVEILMELEDIAGVELELRRFLHFLSRIHQCVHHVLHLPRAICVFRLGRRRGVCQTKRGGSQQTDPA